MQAQEKDPPQGLGPREAAGKMAPAQTWWACQGRGKVPRPAVEIKEFHARFPGTREFETGVVAGVPRIKLSSGTAWSAGRWRTCSSPPCERAARRRGRSRRDAAQPPGQARREPRMKICLRQ